MSTEKVYDLLNCGPRSRFVVRGKSGRPFFAHNCTQWTARMVFAERMLAMEDTLQAEDPRQHVLFSVHDEAVPEIVDPGENAPARKKQLEAMMSVTPAWLEGCPLAAEAKISSRYGK